MGDMYAEYMTAKPRNGIMPILKIIMMVFGVIIVLLSFIFGDLIIKGVLFLAGILLAVAGYFVGLREYVEFEYLCVEKELSVDQILNHERRKKIANYLLGEAAVIAPKGSAKLDEYKDLSVTDYSSELNDGEVFDIILDGASGKKCVRINTDEKMRDALRKSAPSKFFGN